MLLTVPLSESEYPIRRLPYAGPTNTFAGRTGGYDSTAVINSLNCLYCDEHQLSTLKVIPAELK